MEMLVDFATLPEATWTLVVGFVLSMILVLVRIIQLAKLADPELVDQRQLTAATRLTNSSEPLCQPEIINQLMHAMAPAMEMAIRQSLQRMMDSREVEKRNGSGR